MCDVATDELAIPALVMIGDADDWSSAHGCERWMTRRAGRGVPVKFIVYPGAYHSFHIPAVGDGMEMFGHKLKYDPDAASHANTEAREFLSQYLAR
jgi:dienelactone hydrolase